eukprot:5169378-Karenia_brevis.AAC.1
MRSISLKPRTLANDLLIHATGSHALSLFHRGYNKSVQHLNELGAKIAPTKCGTFATRPSHRTWLALHKWESLNTTVKCHQHLRDLGSTLNVICSVRTSVSRTRFQSAGRCVFQILKLPHSKSQKASFIRTAAHPQAFYGSEASHVDEHALAAYTTIVADAITNTSHLRNRALAFTLASFGKDRDPFANIFSRR